MEFIIGLVMVCTASTGVCVVANGSFKSVEDCNVLTHAFIEDVKTQNNGTYVADWKCVLLQEPS